MTSSRRSWQKSTSKSGIETRSGLRKRSNSRPKRSGSRSVMVSGIGDQRARARTAARADRDVVRLRPLDEVGDDQEVAGILHALDDARARNRAARDSPPPSKPGAGPCAASRASGPPRPAGAARRLPRRPPRGSPSRRSVKRGRIGLPRARPVGAAHRDLDRVLERFRQVGEELAPSRRGVLKSCSRREPPALGVGDEPPFGDGEQRVMRLVILAAWRRTARWSPRAAGRGDRRDRCRSGSTARSLSSAVALDLDIEPVAEGAASSRSSRASASSAAAGRQSPGRWGRRARRSRRSAPRSAASTSASRTCGGSPGGGAEIGLRAQPHEVGVALGVGGEQHEPGPW